MLFFMLSGLISTGVCFRVFWGIYWGAGFLQRASEMWHHMQSTHTCAYWQRECIHYAQPWSSPLLRPWPSLITPYNRNNNVSGAPADPCTCRPAQIMHIPNRLLWIQTRMFLILTTAFFLTDAYAAPGWTPPPLSCRSQSWWVVRHVGGQA